MLIKVDIEVFVFIEKYLLIKALIRQYIPRKVICSSVCCKYYSLITLFEIISFFRKPFGILGIYIIFISRSRNHGIHKKNLWLLHLQLFIFIKFLSIVILSKLWCQIIERWVYLAGMGFVIRFIIFRCCLWRFPNRPSELGCVHVVSEASVWVRLERA